MLREKSSAMQHYQDLKLGLLLTLCTMLNFMEQVSIIYDEKKPQKQKDYKKVIRSEITACHCTCLTVIIFSL